jgi:dTDP-4-dehydrorhamnose reductase
MKSVLITGGSGLLALNWARVLAGTSVVHLALHRHWVTPFGATGHRIDLGSEEAIAAAFGAIAPDLVVHAAGLTNIEACEKDPDAAWRINVEMTRNIARVCAQRKVKLVHISTDHIFDGTQSFLDESAEPAPLNVYAQTKATGEAAATSRCPSALVVRTNFYGWGPSYRHSFSDAILAALRERRPITLFADVYFTPILMDALIETVHALVDADASGIFNVVGDERLSKHEFGLRIADRFGLDAGVLKAGNIADAVSLVRRPRDMSLSNRKARAVVGRDLGNIDTHLERLVATESASRVEELRRL